ncbi:hypothetical protein BZA77DRAFT_327152 [Pyronema omphalodes]|nr:hypothetical protein BZA77DRAFT_327152 [Pyronema omphalodes]
MSTLIIPWLTFPRISVVFGRVMLIRTLSLAWFDSMKRGKVLSITAKNDDCYPRQFTVATVRVFAQILPSIKK